MAKQTFTVGQVLTAAQLTSLQQTAMGGGAASAKTASYTLVAADAGTTISMTSTSATTITVNTGLFAAGDTVFIQNLGSGNLTITAGTATVATAGSLILPQNDAGILYFVSTSSSVFYDFIQVGAASPLTTKGDIYTFSTSDTRVGVGANNTVLTADSAEATGLKWATPASGGMTLISTTSLSGASTTISSIPATYNDLVLIIRNYLQPVSGEQLLMRLNGVTSNAYNTSNFQDMPQYARSFGTSTILLGSVNSSSTGSGLAKIQFDDYANTTTRKYAFTIFFGTDATTGTSSTNQGYLSGFNQTGAISSITLLPTSGSFSSGTALLYGVK